MITRLTIFIVAFSVGSSGAALHAQAPERPSVASPKSFTPPKVEEQTLANGLRLALVPYGATPTARIELVIRTGRAYESADEVGLSQLTADYLLEGTTSRTSSALAERLASLGVVGGGFTMSVGSDETIIAAEVLPESVPQVLTILSDVARMPAFDPSLFDRLRANYRIRLQAQSASAAAMAATRVNAILFPSDAADRIPGGDQLAKLTVAEVRAFHARHYVAKRAYLYIAGVFDQARVRAAAADAFNAMTTGSPPEPRSLTNRVIDREPVIVLIDRPGATQSRLQVSFPIVDQAHPDHLFLNELNSLMGSSQTSRIIANVRERRGYSYNVSTRLLRRPGATTWTVQADVNRGVTGAALREILSEIDGLPANPPTSGELRGFQQFMAGGMMAEMSTARGILDYLRFLDLYGLDLSYLSGLVPSMLSVTPADLLRVQGQYLRPARRVIVVVGDAVVVEAQLREIGRVER